MTGLLREINAGAGAARRAAVWLALCMAIGAGLRIWGLDWGLPHRTALHPDEHDYVITPALRVSFQRPDPEFINYPSFLCYSTSLTHGALRRLGVGRGARWRAHLIGRGISALYGLLTILAVYALVLRLGGPRRAASLAALWVAILPLHVAESHVAVTDVMMTFWIVMTMVCSLRLARQPTYGAFAWTGVCLGLAVGSKYTAALAGVVPLATVLLYRPPWRRLLAGLALLGAVSLLACFVVTPFSFLRFPDLLAALRFEHTHVRGNHLGFSIPAAGWQYRRYLYQLVAVGPFSFGVALYASVLAGIAWVLARPRRELWPVLIFFALYFGITGSWTFTPLRYYMPLVVLGTVFAGLWQDAWWTSPARWRRRLAVTSVIFSALYTLAFTVSYTARFSDETRLQAARWVHENVQPGQIVHAVGWGRYTSFPEVPDRRYRCHGENWLAASDKVSTNDFIEVTSLHYLRWSRHGNRNYMNIYHHLNNTNLFEGVVTFDRTFLNRHFYGKLDPMFRSYFISPTIKIYRRRPPGPDRIDAPEAGAPAPEPHP